MTIYTFVKNKEMIMEAKQLLFSCDYKTIGIIENQMLSVFSTDDIEYKNIIEYRRLINKK